MAEEKEKSQDKSSGSGNRRRGRRRYFKRKKNNSGDAQKTKNDNTQKNTRKNAGGDQQRRSKAQRNRRRRRQSRTGDNARSSSPQKLEIDYTPPESVFIYTHVLRPEQRDSYSFRSEISAGTGRTLADFDIDLSLIFPDESKREALVDASEFSIQSEEHPDDSDDSDQMSESGEEQQILDETTQANRFHSDDDTPSTFA